jgi:hypothetical protein
LCTANNPNLLYSPHRLRYFTRTFHRRFNTFRVFSEYAERMKNMQKEISTFNNAWGLKKDSILKKLQGGFYVCLRRTVYKFYFLDIFKKKMLYVYTENMLNSKINTKSLYITANNGLGLKTISRYCPFKCIK